MDLMIIKDVMCVDGKGLVLTGPSFLVNIVSQGNAKWLVGRQASISGKGGQLNVCVEDVSVRQTMSGATEMSLGVKHPPDGVDIPIDSVVTIDE